MLHKSQKSAVTHVLSHNVAKLSLSISFSEGLIIRIIKTIILTTKVFAGIFLTVDKMGRMYPSRH